LAFASELDKGSRSGQDIGRAGYDKPGHVNRDGSLTPGRVTLVVELAAARGPSAGRRGLVERRDGRRVVGLFLF
jgi:hypothetical protein